MGFGAIGHLVAHTRFEDEGATIVKLGVQFPFEAEQDVSFAAPVIGLIAGTVFHHPDPEIAEVAGSPLGPAGYAGMFGRLDTCPVGGAKRNVVDFHGVRLAPVLKNLVAGRAAWGKVYWQSFAFMPDRQGLLIDLGTGLTEVRGEPAAGILERQFGMIAVPEEQLFEGVAFRPGL